jgi:hypothetical protein
MYVRPVLPGQPPKQATMLRDPVHLVPMSYVIQINTYKIIIVFHAHLEHKVKEVQPVALILCVMSFFAEIMNTP